MTGSPPEIRRRPILGMSAVLLPFTDAGDIDWSGFEAHVERTVEAGLIPAVNMDTGFGPVLDPRTAAARSRSPAECAGGWVAGAQVPTARARRSTRRAYRRECAEIAEAGGLPILFPSYGLAALDDDALVAAHERLAAGVDRLLGFELGPMFHPAGRIFSLEVFRRVLEIPGVVGLKHSSLDRAQEWERLAIRDATPRSSCCSPATTSRSTWSCTARTTCSACRRSRPTRSPPATGRGRPATTRASGRSTTCCSTSASSRSGPRCRATATTRRCSSPCAVGSAATARTPPRRAARSRIDRCWPTSPNASSVCSPTAGVRRLAASALGVVIGLAEDDPVEEVGGARGDRTPVVGRPSRGDRVGGRCESLGREGVDGRGDRRRGVAARDRAGTERLGQVAPLRRQRGEPDALRVGRGPGGEHVAVRIEHEREHVARGEPRRRTSRRRNRGTARRRRCADRRARRRRCRATSTRAARRRARRRRPRPGRPAPACRRAAHPRARCGWHTARARAAPRPHHDSAARPRSTSRRSDRGGSPRGGIRHRTRSAPASGPCPTRCGGSPPAASRPRRVDRVVHIRAACSCGVRLCAVHTIGTRCSRSVRRIARWASRSSKPTHSGQCMWSRSMSSSVASRGACQPIGDGRSTTRVLHRGVQRLVVVVTERRRPDAQQRRDLGAGRRDVRRRAVELVHRGDLGPRAAPLGKAVDRVISCICVEIKLLWIGKSFCCQSYRVTLRIYQKPELKYRALA